VAEAHGVSDLSLEQCLALVEEGDRSAIDVFRRAGQVLGRGIGNLTNILNPRLVVVTGEGVRMGNAFIEPMREAMRRASFSLLAVDCELIVQEWGDEAWSQGAASIVIHEMLKPPIYETDVAPPLNRLLDRGNLLEYSFSGPAVKARRRGGGPLRVERR
jgi:predicted NBD/HSP70 family sugar kinase